MNRPGRITGVLAVALVLGSATPASAGGQRSERVAAPLWRELGQPGARRARELLEQALAEVREGSRRFPSDWRTLCTRTLLADNNAESLSSLRGRTRALRELARQAFRKRAHLDNALRRLERARQLAPDEPEVLYAIARVLMRWEQPGPHFLCAAERRDDEAIRALEQLQRAHPEFMPDSVAFELALVLERRGRYAEAAAAYVHGMSLSLDKDDTATMRANLAEVTMLAGELEHAVELYESAQRSANGGRDYLLALWGASVALDRLGEQDAARKQAARAVEAEGGRMAVLRSDGVFFEPEHEIHYYEALGHEALAARPDAASARELAAAAESFRAFIAGSGETGPFHAAARASLERVQHALDALRAVKRKPSRDAPQRATTTAETLP